MFGEITRTTVRSIDRFCSFDYLSCCSFSIWKILALGHGHLNESCVPLLLHALNYESGKTALWNILERDFSTTHWKIRSSAGKSLLSLLKRIELSLIIVF